MKFEHLSENIDRIVAIVEKVPEPFKERCFDALLNAALTEVATMSPFQPPSRALLASDASPNGSGSGSGSTGSVSDANGPIIAKGRYAQFLAEKGISESDVKKIVELEGDEIVFFRTPKVDQKATAQIQWALLLALVNGMRNGNLLVSSDAVREKVKEEKIYDESNFSKIFTQNKTLFLGSMGKNDPERRLSSPVGEEELAKLIKALAS